MDVMSQHFNEADDLVKFVQNRTGKLDGSVVSSYWLGQEHMLKDEAAHAKYIKSCNNYRKHQRTKKKRTRSINKSRKVTVHAHTNAEDHCPIECIRYATRQKARV